MFRKILDALTLMLMLPTVMAASILAFYLSNEVTVTLFDAKCETVGDSSAELLELPEVQTSGLWGQRIMAINSEPGEFVQELADELANWRIINPYVCGILMIDDFDVKEPVIQAKSSNKQWLRTNILGEADINGSVFMDYRCNLKSNAVKMIHGHNMPDGTVFGQLPTLMKKSDCSEMPTVRFYTDNGMQVYEPYSVFSVSSEEEALPLDSLMKYDDVVATVAEFEERSLVPGGEATSLDTLVLNTCWYGESGREHNLHCILVCSRV